MLMPLVLSWSSCCQSNHFCRDLYKNVASRTDLSEIFCAAQSGPLTRNRFAVLGMPKAHTRLGGGSARVSLRATDADLVPYQYGVEGRALESL
jgi:hypothetical protein